MILNFKKGGHFGRVFFWKSRTLVLERHVMNVRMSVVQVSLANPLKDVQAHRFMADPLPTLNQGNDAKLLTNFNDQIFDCNVVAFNIF